MTRSTTRKVTVWENGPGNRAPPACSSRRAVLIQRQTFSRRGKFPAPRLATRTSSAQDNATAIMNRSRVGERNHRDFGRFPFSGVVAFHEPEHLAAMSEAMRQYPENKRRCDQYRHVRIDRVGEEVGDTFHSAQAQSAGGEAWDRA